MTNQDLLLGARVAHVRELKAEIERLRAENTHLANEVVALRAHFDMALLASVDLKALPEGARLWIYDGWNLILGAPREARDRADLLAQVSRQAAERPDDAFWIVYDGPDEQVRHAGRVRVSYTGGKGEHRADRFICAFLRMAAYQGLANRVEVRTNDADFRQAVRRLKGERAHGGMLS